MCGVTPELGAGGNAAREIRRPERSRRFVAPCTTPGWDEPASRRSESGTAGRHGGDPEGDGGLPREAGESPSLEIFQPRLAAVLCPLLWVTLLGQGVGLGDPQRALPTLTMLGFCDTVPPCRGPAVRGAAGAGRPWRSEQRGAGVCNSTVTRRVGREIVTSVHVTAARGCKYFPEQILYSVAVFNVGVNFNCCFLLVSPITPFSPFFA